MSDEGPDAPAWSSGLTRSYSEHAALVLKHFQQQHRRSTPRCTRSGPNFRALQNDDARSEADDEDEDEEAENHGRRTWRISNSEGENQSICQRRKIVEVGCGDSGTLTDEFSDLSLKSQRPQNGENYGFIDYSESSTSQNTKTSVERRCRMFDDDEDDDDDRFTLMTDDIDEHYRPFRQQSSESDTPNESSLRDSQSTTSQSKDHDNNDVGNDSASCSCSSLSAVATKTTMMTRHRLNGAVLKRLISYEDWARNNQEKEQQRREATRRAEQLRREAEELKQRNREVKERRDYDNFLHWVERKKKQQKLKKELVEKEIDLQRTIQNIEDKEKIANAIRLRQWQRKKVEERKASEKQELMKQKRTEEEKQRRLQESVKAYEKWRVKAKNTPRPATQGLLPHQKAKPAFTNPTPWQPLVDGHGSDGDSDGAMQPRSAAGAVSKNQRSKRTCVKR